MPSKRTMLPAACAHCGAEFVPAASANYLQKFCSRACGHAARSIVGDRDAHIRARFKAWLAPRRARAQAFVAEVNARTVCAHCGTQPVEWHNPEHVELHREGYRISALASNGLPIEAIQAEMDRCTPLCRRCHMAEDGRLQGLIAAPRQAPEAPKPCSACQRPYKPLRRGLCTRCYDRGRYVPKGKHPGWNGEPKTAKQIAHYENLRAASRARKQQVGSTSCGSVTHEPRVPETTS